MLGGPAPDWRRKGDDLRLTILDRRSAVQGFRPVNGRDFRPSVAYNRNGPRCFARAVFFLGMMAC